MPWSDYCGDDLVEGKLIDLNTLTGLNVNHNKRGRSELPAAGLLAKMVRGAERLRLRDVVGSGIAFHVAQCAIDGNDINTTTHLNRFVSEKSGAGVCYEDSILPAEIQPGHILVHQSVAPCLRCRAGYKAWARERRCTIVISADDGYDRSGDNRVFVFTPTGLVFYG